MANAVLIADAGSTRCEWRLIENGRVTALPATRGFNPTYEPSENLATELALFREFGEVADRISAVHYYGAGCTAAGSRRKVQMALGEKFPNAAINVRTDLFGAAVAVYSGAPVLCGILGTGSNVCYFDGEELHFATPSLGFILGDEGSGNHIGQLLLRGYFYGQMPAQLRTAFSAAYNLELDRVLTSIYRGKQPAGFLAQFARFAGEHAKNDYIRQVVREAIGAFFKTHVAAFEDHKKLTLGLVGSVAYYFADVVNEAAKQTGVQLGPIMQRPIEALAEYHAQSD